MEVLILTVLIVGVGMVYALVRAVGSFAAQVQVELREIKDRLPPVEVSE